MPTNTLLTEAPPVVRFLIRWKGTALANSFGRFQLLDVESLWRREGGEEGGSEEVIEGAHRSVVRGRSDTQQTWMLVRTSEYLNDAFIG